MDVHAWMERADAAHGAGRLSEAESLAREVLAVDPDNLRGQLLLGVLLAKVGKTQEATPWLDRVLQADPGSFPALIWQSRIARRHGMMDAALAFAERAVRAHPGDADARLNLGLCQVSAHRYEEASATLTPLATTMPAEPVVFHHLGIALQQQNRNAEAVDALKRAVALNPQLVETRVALGQVMIALYDHKGAIEQAESALRVNPKSVAAHHLLVEALIEDQQIGRAETHLQELLKTFPNDSQTHAMWGMRLIFMGRMEEARASLKRSIDIQPVQGFAYCNLVQNLKVTEADRGMVETMEELLKNPSINAAGRGHLHYGLGKAYENLGDYEGAMRHLEEANALAYGMKFGNRPFDRKRYGTSVDWTIQTFDRGMIERLVQVGLDDPTPIFVVGMIRSGTTLVEQILSSHPDVEAGGEQRYWTGHWQEAFPGGAFDQDAARRAAETYCGILHRLAPGAPHVTDKMPGNYAYLGLIHLLLPQARIIHTRRHPVDTCLSIFATPNSARNEFAHDKANIVFGYRQYQRFMAHWIKVLPSDRLMTIDYEELVANREELTRRMVAFCGLAWDDRCLRPQENVRSVVTPSVWQVRQPVYATSVARWRKFEPWLGAFRDLL